MRGRVAAYDDPLQQSAKYCRLSTVSSSMSALPASACLVVRDESIKFVVCCTHTCPERNRPSWEGSHASDRVHAPRGSCNICHSNARAGGDAQPLEAPTVAYWQQAPHTEACSQTADGRPPAFGQCFSGRFAATCGDVAEGVSEKKTCGMPRSQVLSASANRGCR